MSDAKTAAPPVRPDTDAAEAAPRNPDLPPGGIRLGDQVLALGPEVVTRVVTRFEGNVADMERKMRDAVERRDAAALEYAAHSLKGSSGTLGAVRMQEICRRLQGLAEEGSLAGAPALLEELEREHRRILPQLDELRRPQGRGTVAVTAASRRPDRAVARGSGPRRRSGIP